MCYKMIRDIAQQQFINMSSNRWAPNYIFLAKHDFVHGAFNDHIFFLFRVQIRKNSQKRVPSRWNYKDFNYCTFILLWQEISFSNPGWSWSQALLWYTERRTHLWTKLRELWYFAKVQKVCSFVRIKWIYCRPIWNAIKHSETGHTQLSSWLTSSHLEANVLKWVHTSWDLILKNQNTHNVSWKLFSRVLPSWL